MLLSACVYIYNFFVAAGLTNLVLELLLHKDDDEIFFIYVRLLQDYSFYLTKKGRMKKRANKVNKRQAQMVID